MTIEKQLEVLRKALEDGAKIQVSYHDHVFKHSREKAEELISVLDVKQKESNNSDLYWVSGEVENIEITGFFRKEQTA